MICLGALGQDSNIRIESKELFDKMIDVPTQYYELDNIKYEKKVGKSITCFKKDIIWDVYWYCEFNINSSGEISNK